jgi:diguanylate cyclase (GGDEF)-like protein/PAS domain S-box-containing protein
MIETTEILTETEAVPQDLQSFHPEADLYRAVADSFPFAALVTDVACQRILFANRACMRLWMLDEAESVPRFLRTMRAVAADAQLVSELWNQRSELPLGEDGLRSDLLLRDGRQLHWRTCPCLDRNRRPFALLHLFEDTSPVPTRTTPAAAADDLFRLTFEKSAVGMTLISSDFRFLRVNPSFCQMVGYDEGALLDHSLFDLLHPDERGRPGEWEASLTNKEETFHLEKRLVRRDGEMVWAYLSVSVVRDANNLPVFFVAMAENVTDRKREEEERERRTRELQALATTDPLTGVYNHRYMQEYLNHRLLEARRSGQPVSVLMLDLDHFRNLNELYGHDVGDRALRVVASCMQHALRGQDVACRYGGEEFAMILAGAPFAAALSAAERVRRRVEAASPVGPGAQPVTCSIGVATFPDHASTTASLLKAADIALFQAKRSGRNRIAGYEPTPFECPTNHVEQLATGMQGANVEAVNALVTAIDLRDRFTGAHCQRVARVSVELAMNLECTEQEIEILRVGAALLDVGKIGLPDQILTKPGRLTREEWALMREHPVWGEQLVRRSALPPEVAQLVRWHHERLDGSGYPDGLKGDQIPLLVRIVTVADVAAALRDDRPHRRAWPRGRVLEYLRRHAGDSLDERVVEAYCDLVNTK